MRIKVAIIILLLVGIALTANLLIDDKTLDPVQLEEVTTACSGCHGSVPRYDAAIKVHNKHVAFDCIRCHSDVGGLNVTDSAHTGLEWLAIGTMLLALAGVITNMLVINRKSKVN